MRLSLFIASAAILSSGLMARADDITDTIVVTASSPGTYLSLKYTLLFDPTRTYTNETSGITLDALSSFSTNGSAGLIDYGDAIFKAPFGFSYNQYSQSLSIGGLVKGVDSVEENTSDFGIYIDFAESANPVLEPILLAKSGTFSLLEEYPGGVTITQAPAVTPEPSSIALLGTGLLGVAGAARRRLSSARNR